MMMMMMMSVEHVTNENSATVVPCQSCEIGGQRAAGRFGRQNWLT